MLSFYYEKLCCWLIKIYNNFSKGIAQLGLEKFCQETAYMHFMVYFMGWVKNMEMVVCSGWCSMMFCND